MWKSRGNTALKTLVVFIVPLCNHCCGLFSADLQGGTIPEEGGECQFVTCCKTVSLKEEESILCSTEDYYNFHLAVFHSKFFL